MGTDTERLLAGRYLLGRRLGRGGMGTVWLATDQMLDREVAVKELSVGHLAEEDLQIVSSRMKQEARAAARIKHPGVITVHDVLEQDGKPWIVMELIDGRSLAELVEQEGTLTPREAARIGAQVLAALHRGHQVGVIHRDVKPANVLLERGTGRVVLTDFGIATFEGDSALTRTGDLVGSPDYLAPERVHGGRPGPESDLWGLGATLYAAVEGQSPFRRESPLTTLAAVVSEPLPEPRNAGALAPVLQALMAKEPFQRPSTEHAIRMLEDVAAGHTTSFAVPGPLHTPTRGVPVVDRQEPYQPTELVPRQESPERPTVPQQPQAPQPSSLQAQGAEPRTGPTVLQSPPPPVRTEPQAPSRPAPRRRRGAWAWIVVAGIVAAAVGGGVAYKLNSRSQAGPTVNPPASASPVPSDSPSAAPSQNTVPDEQLPTGYTWKHDAVGFSFPLPDTSEWTRNDDRGLLAITYGTGGAGDLYRIVFGVTPGQALSPLQHAQDMSAGNAKQFNTYQLITLQKNTYKGMPGALWEFTLDAKLKDGQTHHLHGKEQLFKDPKTGTEYDLYVVYPEESWLASGYGRFTTLCQYFTWQ